jgi:hypothetical protein
MQTGGSMPRATSAAQISACAAVHHDVLDGQLVGRHQTARAAGDLHRERPRVAGAERLAA